MQKTFLVGSILFSVIVFAQTATTKDDRFSVQFVVERDDFRVLGHQGEFSGPVSMFVEGKLEKEVLAAVMLDASTYLSAADIDDFQSQFCEGMKVSEVLRIWEACGDAAVFLTGTCGLPEELLYNTEEQEWYING